MSIGFLIYVFCFLFFFFKQKTAYEMRISDWSSDVCSSDLSRRLYLYLPARPSQLAQRFVAFAQSDRAQQTVERIGFVSQYVEPYPALVRADAPADYRRIVRNAQRLSLNFR